MRIILSAGFTVIFQAFRSIRVFWKNLIMSMSSVLIKVGPTLEPGVHYMFIKISIKTKIQSSGGKHSPANVKII